jgi:hypothetical protein
MICHDVVAFRTRCLSSGGNTLLRGGLLQQLDSYVWFHYTGHSLIGRSRSHEQIETIIIGHGGEEAVYTKNVCVDLGSEQSSRLLRISELNLSRQ